MKRECNRDVFLKKNKNKIKFEINSVKKKTQ